MFVGGCDYQGVEYMAGALSGHTGPGIAPVDTLAELVESSLLRSLESEVGPRFSMLETVREYADKQLAANGEAEQARRAHAGYYLALAERAEPHLTRPGQSEWLDRLEMEHDNLRAALRYLGRRRCRQGRHYGCMSTPLLVLPQPPERGACLDQQRPSY